MPISQNVLVALIAAGGAILVKIIEKWMERTADDKSNQDTFNEGERIRHELREDVDRLQAENEKLRNESDKWRTKYWKSQTQESARIEELKAEIERLCLVIDGLREENRNDDSSE